MPLCKLERLREGHTVNLESHRNGCCEGSNDERTSHDEPRNDSKIEAAEEVEDKDGGAAKQNLGAGCNPRKIGHIKPKLDGQEESIQESRGAEVLDEFHFRALCSIHKI